MNWLTPYLTQHPELAVFLAIGLGYWIGQFKFKGVGFGPVTGSLIAGLLIGYFFHVPVADTAKQLLFLLFMFGIGYSAGPGFIRGIQDGGWRWAALGLLIPLTGLLTAVAVAKLLNLEMGYAAGMMSGALTESPVIGTASEAIRSLPISDEEKSRLISQIPVADALTYIFGTFGVIFFCSYIGPWLLRLDMKAEAIKLEAEMGMARSQPGISSAWRMYELRAYLLDASQPLVGRTVAQAESAVAPERLFIERIRRGTELFTPQPDTVLQAGDVLAIFGPHEALLRVVESRADEVFDRELLDVQQASFDVEVNSRDIAGRRLADLRSNEAIIRGVFLKTIQRGQEQLPVAPGTVIQRGDLLTIHGLVPAVERVAALVGNISRPTLNTDFVTLGLAIFVGALAGMALSLPLGGLHIALGSSVAVLLVGLAVGWRNSRRPLFAYIPPGAVEFMKSIGLAAFVAMIGLKAGPVFVDAVRAIGLQVFLGGMVVTLTPMFVGLLVGRYVLGLNPLLLLGALAGAQTMTAGLAAIQERSESPVAVIGYSSTVAFGHILISIGGTALIWFLH
ncbi:aspartate:alanine exchanger family transporter [Paucibacter sp. KCTC 42545]|uniref:aspartate:alanine exchanger family transporter n=1 Tax=Paucibacter sp. KCTC 42545 TaxID=1768242 RepID=UPI000733A94D|nr:TrkA C-terminal domain-containing protein [Paucibacter sp. KCTC 42545]ALT78973.1 aspartate-alanine antiporter [Paucibacter sp. KCTC 42545]